MAQNVLPNPIIDREHEKYKALKRNLHDTKRMHIKVLEARESILKVGAQVRLGQVTLVLCESLLTDETAKRPNGLAKRVTSDVGPFSAWRPGAHDTKVALSQLKAEVEKYQSISTTSIVETDQVYERYNYLYFN
jgi:hypothetical protein